jgi:hypothetical protein
MTFPADRVSTVFTVFVNQTLKGDIANGSVILVSQLGRSDCPAAHDPLMNVGDQAVLFLYKIPNSMTRGIFAGQEGRFLIQNGRVNSMDVIYPTIAWPTIHVQDVALDQFVAQVKKA